MNGEGGGRSGRRVGYEKRFWSRENESPPMSAKWVWQLLWSEMPPKEKERNGNGKDNGRMPMPIQGSSEAGESKSDEGLTAPKSTARRGGVAISGVDTMEEKEESRSWPCLVGDSTSGTYSSRAAGCDNSEE